MRDAVLELLKKYDKALDSMEVANELGLKTVEEVTSLMEVIKELEDEMLIYRTRKGKFMLFNNSHLLKGKIHVNKRGFGFVTVEGISEDYYVDEKNMNGALNNDIVVIEPIKGTGKKTEARIVKVLKEENNLVVGEYRIVKGKPKFILDDEKLKMNIIIDKSDLKNLVDGHKLQLSIVKDLGNHTYLGKVNKIIGHKNDPGVDILSIMYSYGINDSFSDEVIKEVNDMPSKVLDSELVGRRDLRDKTIFTIDGDDTKDIDDAVMIDRKGDNYILGVHIADVSHYVKEGMEVYKEAKDRGTSVYLADRVVPMLPHKLSNGICSLNPNEDRLAISCVMEIDKDGNVVDFDVFESVIRSRIQMTYKKVNKILNNEEIPEGYEEYVNDLKQMEELSNILRKNKLKRGYLDFDSKEAKIIVDDNGKAIDVVLREQGKSENIIEDFMIAANETVASLLYYLSYPSLYRVHEVPDDDKIKDFLNQVSMLGIKINGKRDFSNPRELKKILDQLRNTNEFDILSNMLLRCMKKAEYRDENLGHYGLASKCYTHFTSPIRRFPDTTIHNLLRKYIFEKPEPKELNSLIDYYKEALGEIAAHSSEKERDSINCERDVEDMKMAEYMEDHIGEEFEGTIDSIMNFGMFICLPNMIEGLVRYETIRGDYYDVNEELNMVVGRKTGKTFKLGQKIKVKCTAASKENSTIDFEIVEGERYGNTKQKGKVRLLNL